MALHAISYDLSKPGRDYEKLFEAIKAISGTWCHALESLWIVATSLDDAEIMDRLLPAIDANDSLLITELTGQWSAYNLDPKQIEWLKSLTS